MTDVQKQPTSEEVKSDPSMYAPPPYPVGHTQTEPPPLYLPPPYPYGPTVYPSYPPAQGDCNTSSLPPPTCPMPQDGNGTDNLPPEETMPAENTGIQNPESSFDDDTVRRAFIRKVFSVVTLQLLFTFSVVCVFTFSVTVRTAVQKNIWVYVSSYIVFAVVAMCLSLSSSFSRSHPWNLIGLVPHAAHTKRFTAYGNFSVVNCGYCVVVFSFLQLPSGICVLVLPCRSLPNCPHTIHGIISIILHHLLISVVTVSLSYMVGTVASFHNTTAVVIAMGATLAISFTIIIFSAQTRVDFTICNGILLILAMDLVMFGFFSIFFYSQALQILYGCLGALLYALFLAVDCQLVMGRQKYSLSPEEYIFAALIIYLDIITIFLYILILLGGSSNN